MRLLLRALKGIPACLSLRLRLHKGRKSGTSTTFRRTRGPVSRMHPAPDHPDKILQTQAHEHPHPADSTPPCTRARNPRPMHEYADTSHLHPRFGGRLLGV
ncbi:hypothetical protein B0H13DRAFT_2343738 [Mycena leptocephala]|nr:hypothetical protein B0H13DRAFT_2343738 [Mycena leptocephala]